VWAGPVGAQDSLVRAHHTDPVAAGTASAASLPPDVALARGDSLRRAFDTEAALEAYRAGLARDADAPALLARSAETLVDLSEETPGREGDERRLKRAVDLGRRAAKVAPEDAGSHAAAARALGEYGRFLGHKYRVRKAGEVVDLGREAYGHARRAIDLDPYDPEPFLLFGVWHRDLATLNPVVKFVARTFLPHFPDVSLGQAVGYLRRAVRLAPDDVTARLELARAYHDMDEDEAAREEIERALALAPRSRLDHVQQERARSLLAELD